MSGGYFSYGRGIKLCGFILVYIHYWGNHQSGSKPIAACCLIAARARAAARVGERATATSVADGSTGASGTGLEAAATISTIADGRVAGGVSTPSAIATTTVATKKKERKLKRMIRSKKVKEN